MATYYVSTTAVGGGVGTSGDPYTLAEGASNFSGDDRLFIKGDGTYTLSANLTFADCSAGAPGWVETYTTTVGDGGTATFDLNDYTLQIGAYTTWLGGTFSSAKTSGGSTTSIGISTTSMLADASISFTYGAGVGNFAINNYGKMVGCYVETSGSSAGWLFDCGTQTAFIRCTIIVGAVQSCIYRAGCLIDNIIYGNGGAGDAVLWRYAYTEGGNCCIGNTIANWGNDAVEIVTDASDVYAAVFEDNIIWDCGGYGLINSADDGALLVRNNAIGSCTSGRSSGLTQPERGAITLTADPFTNAASGDFTLNSAAGGGELCKGAGLVPPMS